MTAKNNKPLDVLRLAPATEGPDGAIYVKAGPKRLYRVTGILKARHCPCPSLGKCLHAPVADLLDLWTLSVVRLREKHDEVTVIAMWERRQRQAPVPALAMMRFMTDAGVHFLDPTVIERRAAS